MTNRKIKTYNWNIFNKKEIDIFAWYESHIPSYISNSDSANSVPNELKRISEELKSIPKV